MKLYNKTRCPAVLLQAVLLRAARSVGKVRTTGVVVKVTASRHACRGVAYEASSVCEWHLRKRRVGRRRGDDGEGRGIKTDGGYIHLSLPLHRQDALEASESFFRVAAHEWGHVRDYQHGGRRTMAFSCAGGGARRLRHDDRPEERRANRYVAEAVERIHAGRVLAPDDDILALALWLDEQQQRSVIER